MQWSNRPPEGSSHPSFPLMRAPSKGNLQAYVISDDLVGLPTHFAQHRTMPCEGNGCKHCAEGYSWRWHGYLAILSPRTHAKAILELTAQACEPIADYRDAHGTLRGALIEVWRPSQKPNGRVAVRLAPADLRGRQLPDPPHLETVLCHIWGIHPDNVKDNGHVRRMRAILAQNEPDPVHDRAS